MTALIIAFLWALGCLLFDALNTNKGLRAGVAEEGNSLITSISGTKYPKLWQLLSIDGTIRLLILGIAFIPGSEQYPQAFLWVSFGGLISAGLKNIQGGLKWRWIMKNLKPLPQQNSAWSQFLGFWGL